MGNKVNDRSMFINTLENNNEKNKEKQILEEAREVLQDFDSFFIWERPSCEELPGNTIICYEMDLFELYICVIVKELRHGVNIGSVRWRTVEISGKKVVYPYIEEIWNAIEKEYREKTCSKITTNSVFSRRVKRCGKELQDKNGNTTMEADLIFLINGKDTRENKYYQLIALLCIYSKEFYDKAVEHIVEKSLLSDVEKTLKEMRDDYFNREIKSETIQSLYDRARIRWRINSEKYLYNRENSPGHIEEKNLSIRFWDRFTVCSQWNDSYDI